MLPSGMRHLMTGSAAIDTEVVAIIANALKNTLTTKADKGLNLEIIVYSIKFKNTHTQINSIEYFNDCQPLVNYIMVIGFLLRSSRRCSDMLVHLEVYSEPFQGITTRHAMVMK